jgi:hypothetical protein
VGETPLESVAEEVEADMLRVPSAIRVFAVHDPCLLGMQFETVALVFAVLDRQRRGWRRITMTPRALRRLQDLRRELLGSESDKIPFQKKPSQ